MLDRVEYPKVAERELLERALAFWERIANAGLASESLRQELVELLHAYRAHGLDEGAWLLRRARRDYGRDEIDAVSRYVLAQLEEELQRRAHGQPPREDLAGRSSADTPN